MQALYEYKETVINISFESVFQLPFLKRNGLYFLLLYDNENIAVKYFSV